jgi:hypothetical protein
MVDVLMMSCAMSQISKSPPHTLIDELDPWQSPHPGTTSILPRRPYSRSPKSHEPSPETSSCTSQNSVLGPGPEPTQTPTYRLHLTNTALGQCRIPEKDTGMMVTVDTGYSFTSRRSIPGASRGFPKEQVLPGIDRGAPG